MHIYTYPYIFIQQHAQLEILGMMMLQVIPKLPYHIKKNKPRGLKQTILPRTGDCHLQLCHVQT